MKHSSLLLCPSGMCVHLCPNVLNILVCVCVCVCVCLCVSICLPVCLSVCLLYPTVILSLLSVGLPVCLSFCPSVHVSVYPPFVHLSICPFVHLSICPFVHLSICPSIRLSVHLFLSVFSQPLRLSTAVCPSLSTFFQNCNRTKPGNRAYLTFLDPINSALQKARLFVAVSHFRPSLIFSGKPVACTIKIL